MPYAKYERFLQDLAGNALSGATVDVFFAGTTNRPTLYADENGATTRPNPFTSESDGKVWFYVADGVYDVKATYGSTSVIFANQQVFHPANRVSKSGDTMSGTLSAPTIVVGTDPGGTEVLRAQNARLGATTLTGSLTASGQTITAGTVIAGTDPGGTEALRAQSSRLGSAVVTGLADHTGTATVPRKADPASPTVGELWINTDRLKYRDNAATPTTREVVDLSLAQTLSNKTITASPSVSASTIIAGADPGGTEALRAGSARLNAPVLLGSVPQFTMAADPTAAMQVATKQYVDKLRRRSVVLVVPGSPSAAMAPATARVIMPVAGTIVAVKSTCRVAVSSGTYTFDLNKNGTTMYTTQANRPTRGAADGTGAKTHTLPDVTTFAAGDVLDVDVDAVGSGIQDFALFVEFDVT